MQSSKKYKVWLVVEEITTDEEGHETYEDLSNTESAGTYDTEEEAMEVVEEISNNYSRP